MKVTKFILILVFAILESSTCIALPRFALTRGETNCSGCHWNPTGGGLRTAGGLSYEINQLPMWQRGDSFSGQITPAITLGADFRNQFLSFVQKEPLYSYPDTAHPGSGINTIGERKSSTTTFQAMSYAIELGVQATKTLSGYFRYDPITPNPEMYALWHIAHPSGEVIESGSVVNDVYVKFGAFMPAFGIRFDDHSVYTRGGNAGVSGFDGAGLFWTYAYRDVGAELGTSLFDHASIALGVYNGSETYSGANYSTQNPNLAFALRANISGELVQDVIAGEIGASLYNHPLADPSGISTGSSLSLKAIHGGVRVGPVSVLAEYDMGTNVNLSNRSSYLPKVNAKIVEATLTVTKGLETLLRFETYENENAAGVVQMQVKDRITIGAQWFPLRFVEIRPEFRIAKLNNSDQSQGLIFDQTQTTLLTQIHLFF